MTLAQDYDDFFNLLLERLQAAGVTGPAYGAGKGYVFLHGPKLHGRPVRWSVGFRRTKPEVSEPSLGVEAAFPQPEKSDPTPARWLRARWTAVAAEWGPASDPLLLVDRPSTKGKSLHQALVVQRPALVTDRDRWGDLLAWATDQVLALQSLLAALPLEPDSPGAQAVVPDVALESVADEDLDDEVLLDVADLCERLRYEPLFHASLGSRELFHSNLLAWLCDSYPEIAEQVLGLWLERDDQQREHRVLREPRQLDLVVWLPGFRPLVVENKVFAAPDTDQLDGYGAKNVPAVVGKDVVPTQLLLSLSHPGWERYAPPRGAAWQWASYGELAQALRDVEQLVRAQSTFAADLLVHYVGMLDDLLGLVHRLGGPEPGQRVDLGVVWKPVLQQVRLWDSMRKLRSRQLVTLLRQRYADEGLHVDVVAAGFTRGQVLLETKLRLPNGDLLGWQLQGNQWRRQIEVLHRPGMAKVDLAGLDAYVEQHFAGYIDVERMLEVAAPLTTAQPAAKPKEFKHFGEFVYRYVKVPDLTVGQLLELSVATVRDATTQA